MSKLAKAQLEVRKIKLGLGDSEYQYREVTPHKINYKPAIFTFLMSLVSIGGVLAALYYLV